MTSKLCSTYWQVKNLYKILILPPNTYGVSLDIQRIDIIFCLQRRILTSLSLVRLPIIVRNLLTKTAFRWQYGTCVFHAGYLRLQTHTIRLFNTYCFTTATMVTRICFNVTLYQLCLPCFFRWLMLLHEVQEAIHRKNHAKLTNSICEQNEEDLNVATLSAHSCSLCSLRC